MTRIEAAAVMSHQNQESSDSDDEGIQIPNLRFDHIRHRRVDFLSKNWHSRPGAGTIHRPDSRLIRDKGPLCRHTTANFRAMPIIVAAELSNQAPGVGLSSHLIDLVPSNCEQTPKAALAATGYFVDANVRARSRRCNKRNRPPRRAEGGLRLQTSQPEEAHRQSQ